MAGRDVSSPHRRFPARRAKGEPFSMGGWLNDLAGRTKNLVDEVNSPTSWSWWRPRAKARRRRDHRRSLQRQARDDDGAHSRRRIGSSDETLSKMLAQLRPHVMMLVISSADEYIKDMLTALRA
jgi:hypothetical protein